MNPALKHSAAHAVAAVVLLLTASVGIQQPAHAGKDSIECGYVVVSDLTLKGDIGPCRGDGLTVIASGITLNLNGYKVFALRRQNIGIRLANVSNVVVKGGVVDGFDSGVLLSGGFKNIVTNISTRNNRTGVRVAEAISAGHLIDKNSIRGNRLFGILTTDASDITISKNLVNNNFGYGIVLGSGSSFNSIVSNEAKQNLQRDIELVKEEWWVTYENFVPPLLSVTASNHQVYIDGIDFHIGGYIPSLIDITARVVPVGVLLGSGATALDNPIPVDSSVSGCTREDYISSGLNPGDIALVQRGSCLIAQKVQSAQQAGAVAVIVFNEGQSPDRTDHDFGFVADFDSSALAPANVVFASYRVGFDLYHAVQFGQAFVRLKANNTYFRTPGPSNARHNKITKNTANRAGDENFFCAGLTNQWIKNLFESWNRQCVAGDLSGDGGPQGTGSRARLY